MSAMDEQRAEWLASADADEYFERLQEQRDGYGQEPEPDHGSLDEPADLQLQLTQATRTLQQVDRALCRHTLGELTMLDTYLAIRAAVAAWTDPDGPAGGGR